jgi:hypothetical protein
VAVIVKVHLPLSDKVPIDQTPVPLVACTVPSRYQQTYASAGSYHPIGACIAFLSSIKEDDIASHLCGIIHCFNNAKLSCGTGTGTC